jgi:hypothetical protein
LTANGGVVNGINQDSKITLPNSDFEKSSVIPPPTWSLQGTPTVTYETVTQAPNKKQSIKIATTASSTGLTSNQFFSARPNDTYTIRGMAKADGTSTAFLALTFADKNGAVISSINATTSSAAWTQLSVTGTAPATSVSVSVQLLNSVAAASTVWFDQISAADVSIVGASLSSASFPNTLSFNNMLISATFPTIAGAGCGGSAASITGGNSTAEFGINVGTAPTAGGCTLTMPAATTGWDCKVTDVTTNSVNVFLQKQTGAGSTTSVVLQNFSDVAVATAPTANDIWRVSCYAY